MKCKPKPAPIPFRRSRPQRSKVLWRSGRVIQKGKDMQQLRAEAFSRSDGYCEAPKADHADDCPYRIFWTNFELHHIKTRAQGGSDTLENVLCLSRQCHRKAHGL